MPRKAAPWYRTATGRWYVYSNGKQQPLPVTDPKDEAGAWKAFQALVDRAVAESTAKPAGRPEPVAALVGDYLDSMSHRVAPKTRHDYASHLKRFVALFGNSASGQIDPATVEKRAAEHGWSDSHRANYLWAVQAFVRWTGRKDFTLTRPPKESRGADSLIPPEIHARVLRETCGDFHQLARLLWATGARPMEAAGLEAGTIDWTSATATIRRHKTKHKGKRRVIYLGTEALAILREQADRYADGPLFRGLGCRPFTRHAIVCRFIRMSDKIGRPVRAYDYRHTFITRSLMKGVPSAVVAALVGTSTSMIDRFYGHVAGCSQELREAAEKLAG